MRRIGFYLEPLGTGLAPDVELSEVTVEVGVAERLARVLEGRVAVPFELDVNVGGMRLLPEAPLDVLLRVANLGPAVMAADLGRGIGVYLRQRRARSLDEIADVSEGHG